MYCSGTVLFLFLLIFDKNACLLPSFPENFCCIHEKWLDSRERKVNSLNSVVDPRRVWFGSGFSWVSGSGCRFRSGKAKMVPKMGKWRNVLLSRKRRGLFSKLKILLFATFGTGFEFGKKTRIWNHNTAFEEAFSKGGNNFGGGFENFNERRCFRLTRTTSGAEI